MRSAEKREQRFFSVSEYAEHVGKCERTVRNWMYRGMIPVIKMGEGKNGGILIDPIKADLALERGYERKEVVVK
jgi:hypothetical protein